MNYDKPVLDFGKKYNLTTAQLDVVQCLMDGLNLTEAGERLGRTSKAISHSLQNISKRRGFSHYHDIISEIYKTTLWELENNDDYKDLKSQKERMEQDLKKVDRYKATIRDQAERLKEQEKILNDIRHIVG